MMGSDQVFKLPKSATGLRPSSTLEPIAAKSPVPNDQQPRLRMTTPKIDEDRTAEMWNPGKSVAP
jgi:hypothetical protein